jgi:dihydroanticapsin dehydrogenase
MIGRLSGKRILLTGGVANIGYEVLRSFVAEGAKVSVLDINDSNAEDLQEAFGDRIAFFKTDLSDEGDIQTAISRSAVWMGGIDCLCLNAGVQTSSNSEDLTVADWDRVYSINVRANFILVRDSLRYLKEGQKSSIIMTSSLAGKRGAPGLLAYSSSKAAVIGMATTLALELAPHAIRVNAICPGWIDTSFNNPVIERMGGTEKMREIVSALVPLGRQASVAEVAPMFVYLASDEASYITAQAFNIDGGVYN